MTITAQQVKELREMTGSGMMECKKALVEAKGDLNLAADLMRKSGQAKALKKAGRIAAEGVIVALTSPDHRRAALVEVNCETDFVAREAAFIEFANLVAEQVLATKKTEPSELAALMTKEGSLDEIRQALVIKIGENIQIRRAAYLESEGAIGHYVHSSRIGSLVALTGPVEVAKDLAMHVAASNPLVVNPEDVDPAVVAKEKDIFIAQAKETGKPLDIIEKMVGGRISKFLAEVSLVKQAFVKNPEITVEQHLKAHAAKAQNFVRMEVGEGIEKVETDFAAEVMLAAKQ